MEWNKKIRELLRQVGYVRLVLLFVCILFLILVNFPEEQEAVLKNESGAELADLSCNRNDNDIYVEKMEERLTEILKLIEGAGRVEVMITLSSSYESVVNKDQILEEESETESGKEKRSTVQKEETVFAETGNDLNPYIIKTMEPAIEGIIVVMDGGDNPLLVEGVTEAVQALFHVESHKIKVLKMEVLE